MQFSSIVRWKPLLINCQQLISQPKTCGFLRLMVITPCPRFLCMSSTLLYRKQTTLYDVLRVSRDATQGEIKAAFFKLAKQKHPDTKDGDADDFGILTEAYDTLSNSTKREEYDRTLPGHTFTSKRTHRSRPDTRHDTPKPHYSHGASTSRPGPKPHYSHGTWTSRPGPKQYTAEEIKARNKRLERVQRVMNKAHDEMMGNQGICSEFIRDNIFADRIRARLARVEREHANRIKGEWELFRGGDYFEKRESKRHYFNYIKPELEKQKEEFHRQTSDIVDPVCKKNIRKEIDDSFWNVEKYAMQFERELNEFTNSKKSNTGIVKKILTFLRDKT